MIMVIIIIIVLIMVILIINNKSKNICILLIKLIIKTFTIIKLIWNLLIINHYKISFF